MDSDRQRTRFAEAWTHRRPGKRCSLRRLVVVTTRGEESMVFAIQVHALTPRVSASQPAAMSGGALDRALWATIRNALRMHCVRNGGCAERPRRDGTKIRPRKSRVKPFSRLLRSHSELPSRNCPDVPRASAVNARRPRRTGGVEAERRALKALSTARDSRSRWLRANAPVPSGHHPRSGSARRSEPAT